MLSCASCGYVPNPRIPYLESPCATCKLANDSPTTKRPALFDTEKVCTKDGEEASYLARVDKALEAAGDDDCTITKGVGLYLGGNFRINGTAVVVVSGCTISDGSAEGGAMYIRNTANVTVSDTLFEGNNVNGSYLYMA